MPVSFDDSGRLAPKVLKLSPAAKAAWIGFSNQVELQLGADGRFCDVRGAAAKTAENAARIACLFHVLQHGTEGEVGLEDFNSAKAIAAWHLGESVRFFGEIAMPPELAAAARLEAWLVDFCRRNQVAVVPAAAVQKSGPSRLRAKADVEAALAELAVLQRVRVLKQGRAKSYAMNPAILDAERTARTARTATANPKDEKGTMAHCINQEEVEI
jgi:putative DNA primase/helicase